MSCGNKNKINVATFKEINHEHLEEMGRGQFFYHYPKSTLPIRDITKKTEPHIEIGAENYLLRCIPNNISGFCKGAEKYLFLCTTCRNGEVGEGKFFGKRFVIGYIQKGHVKKIHGRWVVFGETYLVPFNEKLNYEQLGLSRPRAMRGAKTFDKNLTTKLLKTIHSHRNIKDKCIEEMFKWEKFERKRGNKPLKIDEKCLGKKCDNYSQCPRRKIHDL